MTNGTIIFCPAGYKLVPAESTTEVNTAMDSVPVSPSAGYWNKVYTAMLSAAPPQPKGLEREAIVAAIMKAQGRAEPLKHTDYEIADAILAAAKGEKK